MTFAASRFSGFFRRSLFAMGDTGVDLVQLNALIAAPVHANALRALLDAFDARFPPEAALRRARRVLLLALAERDITGQASLAEVCTAMTAFAELATARALRLAGDELVGRFGVPRGNDGQAVDLLAVGMGKGGAGELNVSSDLDLVLLFREEGQTDGLKADGSPAERGSIPVSDFMHRLARRAINILADATAEGFVFRVDTRLRPNGDSGPLVCSFAALEDYLQVQGREWERFAWLKGRTIATTMLGDEAGRVEDERQLASLISPFVFRRYLDYEIFASLRELHDTIQQEARRRELRRAEGIDVKLGRGGIREIEFIAQLFQIVRGGKDRGLRDRSTLTTLATLGERGILEAAEAADLANAYVLLRRTEHMIQYREDQQTHQLPAQADVRDDIAAMLGMAADDFQSRLNAARERVESIFDNLLHSAPRLPSDVPAPIPVAESAQDDGEFDRLAQGLIEGPRYRAARTEARAAIDTLLAQARRLSVSRDCALRLIALLETICRRPGYLALLAQYPIAFRRVLSMLDTSEWAAAYLTRHPVLLDELIAGDLLASTDFEQWQGQLREELAATRIGDEPDVERQMDVTREWHHAQLFRILSRDLEGLLTMEQVSDELSELADRVLQVALEAVWSGLPWKFRDSPAVAIIAYGRLGGKELGYASDLDLVFLFDDADEKAQLAYSKLAQRLTTWLSVQTPAGTLFEIDLRLRPDGDAGMIVSSMSAFEHYQRESAWLWEHQALTRARYCAGDSAVGARFEALRRELIAKPRDRDELALEIRKMRRKMHDGHPNRSKQFDLKHDSGGMVDTEFIVQYLVLGSSHQVPALLDNAGNIALLGRAAKAGLIDAQRAQRVADAYRGYRRRQHAMRLQGKTYARVEPGEVAAEREQVRLLWQETLGDQP